MPALRHVRSRLPPAVHASHMYRRPETRPVRVWYRKQGAAASIRFTRRSREVANPTAPGQARQHRARILVSEGPINEM